MNRKDGRKVNQVTKQAATAPARTGIQARIWALMTAAATKASKVQ